MIFLSKDKTPRSFTRFQFWLVIVLKIWGLSLNLGQNVNFFFIDVYSLNGGRNDV